MTPYTSGHRRGVVAAGGEDLGDPATDAASASGDEGDGGISGHTRLR